MYNMNSGYSGFSMSNKAVGMKVTKKDIASKKEVLEELGFVEKN